MKITEENFISRLKHKDEKALEYVIDNYAWIIKTVIKKHLFTLENHQEECMNDIIFAIWNNIDRFDESKSSFKNWVASISKYKSIDYLRKYKEKVTHDSIDDLDIASNYDVHEEITKEHISEELEDMLNQLKPQDKELFVKLYIEQKDLEEVALDMGTSKNTLYIRASRGKKKLRDMFKSKER